MSDARLEEFAERLEKLERQGRLMRMGGLGLLVVLAGAAISGPSESPGRPDRSGSIRVEKIEFVDAAGKTRAVLSVQDGPFTVLDRTRRWYCDSGRGSCWSIGVEPRTVPALADLPSDLLEQIARDLHCKPDEVSRMFRKNRMPVLVLSDSTDRPREIIETAQIEEGLSHDTKN